MKHLKYLMPIAAFALVGLFGCDSGSSTDANANTDTKRKDWYSNNSTVTDSVQKNFENAVSEPGNSGNEQPSKQDSKQDANQNAFDGSTGLVSCYFQMGDVFRTRACIEANVAFADSVKMMCTTDVDDPEVEIVSATLGNGCPSGAVRICSEKDKNGTDSAKTYYYGAMFASFSCEELLADEDEEYSEIRDVSKDDPVITKDPVTVPEDVQSAETYACYQEEICVVYPSNQYDPSEACPSDEGTIVKECPAGGEQCGVVIEGMTVTVYPNSYIDCDMIRGLAE